MIFYEIIIIMSIIILFPVCGLLRGRRLYTDLPPQPQQQHGGGHHPGVGQLPAPGPGESTLTELGLLFVTVILHVVLQAPSTGVFVPQGFAAGSQFNRIFGPGGTFAQVFGRRK